MWFNHCDSTTSGLWQWDWGRCSYIGALRYDGPGSMSEASLEAQSKLSDPSRTPTATGRNAGGAERFQLRARCASMDGSTTSYGVSSLLEVSILNAWTTWLDSVLNRWKYMMVCTRFQRCQSTLVTVSATLVRVSTLLHSSCGASTNVCLRVCFILTRS